jgi:hypothetical protein
MAVLSFLNLLRANSDDHAISFTFVRLKKRMLLNRLGHSHLLARSENRPSSFSSQTYFLAKKWGFADKQNLEKQGRGDKAVKRRIPRRRPLGWQAPVATNTPLLESDASALRRLIRGSCDAVEAIQ